MNIPNVVKSNILSFLSSKEQCYIRQVNKLFSNLPVLSDQIYISTFYDDVKVAKLLNTYKLKAITSIDLSYNGLITDSSLQQFDKCEKLQHLNLAGCKHITGLYINKFKYLQHLNLTDCRLVDDIGFNEFKQLKYLNVRSYFITDVSLRHYWCVKITDASVTYIEQLPNLQELNLGWCNQITHIDKIKNLTRLQLDCCSYIVSVNLTNCPRLLHLDLNCCHRIDKAVFENISNLINLQQLHLTSCYNITDIELSYFVKLKQLHYLNLSNCYNITDIGLFHLSELYRLQHLDLYECYKITDIGLSHLIKLKKLQYLELFGCYEITNNGVYNLRNIKYLGVERCPKVNNKIWTFIVGSCLFIGGCYLYKKIIS